MIKAPGLDLREGLDILIDKWDLKDMLTTYLLVGKKMPTQNTNNKKGQCLKL